jgi:non-ribosomal peptide synthetase component F
LTVNKNIFLLLHIISVSDLDAVIEQQMSMTGASMFWFDTLYDCNLDRSLQLPFDRYRLADEHRTGRGISVEFDFGEYISRYFLTYASSNDIVPKHVALTCYHIFLFELTNGERDLCIGMNTHGRYKEELMSIIGMFVNAIPLRSQLDPHWSFHQLIEYVRDITTSSVKYSYFPLQRILTQHPNVSKPAFLDTSFDFHSIENETANNDIMIGDSRLQAMPWSIQISENEIMSKFDFSLTIQHDPNSNQLSCTIDASLDLFDLDTIEKIAQRFHSMFKQIFLFTNDQMKKPIYELSLILSDERILKNSMNNTQASFPSVNCIHHEFVCQVMKHSQKLSVELDEQSLTYSELLYYVQILSLHLLINYRIIPGDIICQCVERSLSMVS